MASQSVKINEQDISESDKILYSPVPGPLFSQATVLCPLQDLLAPLHEQRQSTKEIFQFAASENVSWDPREALDSGSEICFESQPAHLLTVILKMHFCRTAGWWMTLLVAAASVPPSEWEGFCCHTVCGPHIPLLFLLLLLVLVTLVQSNTEASLLSHFVQWYCQNCFI